MVTIFLVWLMVGCRKRVKRVNRIQFVCNNTVNIEPLAAMTMDSKQVNIRDMNVFSVFNLC